MTTKNSGKHAALAAALTLLGVSLGIGTQASAGTTTSTAHKNETIGITLKDVIITSKHKGETTSTQHKEPTSKQQKFFRPTPRGDGTTE